MLERYEEVMGFRINRGKASGLRLVALKGVALTGPFNWIDGPVDIFGV